MTTNANDVDLTKIPGYEPDKPPRRLDEATWYDELEAMWGRKWGACSTIGKLRTAMVTRPTDAYIETVIGHFGSDARALNLGSNARTPDAEKLKHDHDTYVQLLQSNGVEVLYADLPEPMFGIYTRIRSHIAPEPTVIRGGAIMARTAIAVKRGMEPHWQKVFADLKIPILATIHGAGIYEGRIDWLDPHHACLGYGVRANWEGIQQMEYVLRLSGVEDVHVVHLPAYLESRRYSHGPVHLCNVFCLVDRKVALVYPQSLPYEFLEYLRGFGIELIEIPEDEMEFMPGNSLPLEAGRLVIPKGSPRTVDKLTAAGVECIEVDFEQFTNVGGGPTCLTLALIRNDGPLLDA